MNATFETVRKELKKYNAEDNDAPVKLLVAGKNDFLDKKYKKKSVVFRPKYVIFSNFRVDIQLFLNQT